MAKNQHTQGKPEAATMLKDIPFQDVIIPSCFLKVVYLGLIMTINVVMELNTMIYVSPICKHIVKIQAFLDFRGFDFRDFQFNTVYNSILFSSPLVLQSNLDLSGFLFPCFFYVSPH